MLDRRRLYELYECAAQNPERQVQFLRAVAGESARRFGEDFCGTGSLSVAWAQLSAEHSAIAVDHDPFPLTLLVERAERAGVGARIDVYEHDISESVEPADLIAALNFSIGYFFDRNELVEYLRRVLKRVSDGGTFVCDVYGGMDQFTLGESDLDLSDGVRYIWEQRRADPLTARVVNAMHFETSAGENFRDAFVYEWRLWSPAELHDAMLEAGFAAVEFYDRLGEGKLDDGSVLLLPACAEDLDENYVIYAVARA